ncbi:MAG: YbaB/EbfC family nucleoid-associated protein [Oscillospiraceae bacterium]
MKARLPQGMGGGAPTNMQGMIKQAQKMQEDMAVLQAELESTDYTTTVGGGAVEVIVTGKKEIKSLNIKPEVVDPEDVEMLQDLIISAVNEAMRNVEADSEEKMAKVTGGMNMPFGL